MNEQSKEFWPRKLLAFLHDTPDKQFDLGHHEERAAVYQHRADFTDEEARKALSAYCKPADHFSSAAERFVFPKGKCSHNFAEDRLFIHPLSSQPHKFQCSVTSARMEEAIQTAVAGIPMELEWHAKFFLYWRRWMENAATTVTDTAFIPADSRIPDHTIWNHMAVTSALVPCISKGKVQPELLLFQMGSVQEFIAQARTTRDLWSGSYLISWLMAHAIKAVTDRLGPDALIFPSLRGNGIFDALHREIFYNAKWKHGDQGEEQSTWERLLDEKGGAREMADWLLTPTLPNRFLAIVPPGEGAQLAQAAEQALRAELEIIGDKVWQWLNLDGAELWHQRFKAQVKAFPQITWATQEWLEREECLAAVARLPKDEHNKPGLYERLTKMIEFAESLDKEEQDQRYFDQQGKLKNSGILWSAHYALLDAKLAARRNTRDFAAWDPVNKSAAVKDSLSGKEECIGDESFWKHLNQNYGKIFTAASHRYGAMNLIKRLWCHPQAKPSYLSAKLGLEAQVYEQALNYPSTKDMAKRNDTGSPYIAVLSLDGDEMGKWISGARTPAFLAQLAPKAREHLKRGGSLQRLLTPSYHLQFSEALANFAMHQARAVVQQHDGKLIYAGGDDVLALLPSSRVIACARALRAKFRVDFDGNRIYPGSACDISCGIAVGHHQAPLQMLVRQAQAAEKRAKKEYNRGALAIDLYKRSGEIIKWGCKWESGALELMQLVTAHTNAEKLSGRFPYALAALLKPYALSSLAIGADGAAFAAMQAVVKEEVKHVLARQGKNWEPGEQEDLLAEIERYLAICWEPIATDSEDKVLPARPGDFINLFLTETFMNRFTSEN